MLSKWSESSLSVNCPPSRVGKGMAMGAAPARRGQCGLVRCLPGSGIQIRTAGQNRVRVSTPAGHESDQSHRCPRIADTWSRGCGPRNSPVAPGHSRLAVDLRRRPRTRPHPRDVGEGKPRPLDRRSCHCREDTPPSHLYQSLPQEGGRCRFGGNADQRTARRDQTGPDQPMGGGNARHRRFRLRPRLERR